MGLPLRSRVDYQEHRKTDPDIAIPPPPTRTREVFSSIADACSYLSTIGDNAMIVVEDVIVVTKRVLR